MWSFLACFVGFVAAAIVGPAPETTSPVTATTADITTPTTGSSEPEEAASATPAISSPDVESESEGARRSVDRPMPRQAATTPAGDPPIRTGTTKLTSDVPETGGPSIAVDDIYWDADTRPYQEQLLAAANRIQVENTECGEVQDIVESPSRSTPEDPVFFVVCAGTKGIPFNVWVRPTDAENAASFAAIRPIGQGPALAACQQAAKDAANNSSSVDFSVFIDVAYQEFANGRAILSSTFTARNAFNAESKYEIRCYFDGLSMSEVEIADAQ